MALHKTEAFYFAVEPIWQKVSEDGFYQYIKEYPRPLSKDIGSMDPPSVSYNDFALADRWPESVVAKCACGDKRKYWVMENYGEVFASKTGKMASTHGEPPNPFLETFHGDFEDASDFIASGTLLHIVISKEE